MSVRVAKLAGFCFGVKRAVDSVVELAEKNDTNIYTLGKLIHNETVISRLQNMGVAVIDAEHIEALAKRTDNSNKTTVVIRAHGVTKAISDKLNVISQENNNFFVCDLTCPLVKKIHNIAAEHTNENTYTLIFGDKNHPEVEGICSYVKGDFQTFLELDEIDLDKISEKSVVMISQTTQKLTKWKKSQEYIKKYCTNLQIFDTICSVTENRQREVDEISKECDVIFVIGGKESSNTKKLFEVAKAHQPNTFLIESADDIKPAFVTNHIRVGIVAGASTPGDIIKEVETRMSDIQKTEAAEDFAAILDSNDQVKPIKNKDRVSGTVIAVSGAEVKVDLDGGNVTGIITEADLVDPSAKLTDVYHVGDHIDAVAVRVSDLDGTAILSRKGIESEAKWNELVELYNSGEALEGKIIQVVKGGVIILINSNRVFIPNSQTGLSRNADPSVLVGTTQKVKIIEINENRRRAVASIRVIAREERKAAEEEFWADMAVGKTFTGKVKSLTSYGAFVDLGAFDGMVHITELSWKRIKNPAEVVKVGDVIDVFVLDFDKDKRRISLGYKTEATNPWTLFTSQYKVDDVVSVKIANIMPFGAFAEIIPGADGLIHISHITSKKIASPKDVLKVGDVVDAKIIEIDYENQRISLSMKALEEPEESEVEETPDEAEPVDLFANAESQEASDTDAE